MKSGQYLISNLLNSSNWSNSTDKYVSFIELLSLYNESEIFNDCRRFLKGVANKTNVQNETINFLGMAQPGETTIFYYCGDSGGTNLGLDELITADELTSWLMSGGLPQANVCVVLDCCNSGAWINDGQSPGNPLGQGRVVLCSSRSNESSWSWGISAFSWFTGQEKTPYILHGPWKPLGVVGGLYAANDTNENGFTDMMEDFEFAKNSTEEYASLQNKTQNPVAYNGIGHDIPFVLRAPSVHDVAVTIQSKNVTSNSTSTSINVTTMNQGNTTETFNVTLYANTTNIGTQTVSLSNGSSTSLTFNWNTVGLDYGNYTITAYATPVPGETDTADNTFSCWIVVTIPGDIDGNFKVSLADLVILAHAYGSKPGDSNWNPNADIDGNNIVGLSDLVILAQNYGQQYP
jgi:hypothetical protein